MRWLVTGFGPFLDVVDNPAARLARALHGRRDAAVAVIGAELPVSYARGVAQTLELARVHRVDAVLGIGVSPGEAPRIERFGRARCGETPDVDGVCSLVLPGPERVELPHAGAWAEALGVSLSEDAGRYVCNGWLHQVACRAAVPVGFLHVPPAGMEPASIFDGLRRIATGRLG